jgi:hypothetical protein
LTLLIYLYRYIWINGKGIGVMHPVLFLAHGAWGIWDELLPVLLLVGFVVIFVAAGVISRLRDSSSPAEPPQPSSPEQPNPSADHYRLD